MYNKKEMNYYWDSKEERAKAAKEHTQLMKNNFSKETAESIGSSVVFKDNFPFNPLSSKFKETQISVEDIDTVAAIEKYAVNNIKTVALNFASYKYPGGGFLSGSRAQEECLCHASNLYNVIGAPDFSEFYYWNQKHLNKALYLNRAIYSPDIIFNRQTKCDVLTCASPNYSAASKYDLVTKKENDMAMHARCQFVLYCCAHMGAETLILGAFGCGVFGQDPKTVAEIFKDLINNEFKGVFNKVVFAIPKSDRNTNYEKFASVLG